MLRSCRLIALVAAAVAAALVGAVVVAVLASGGSGDGGARRLSGGSGGADEHRLDRARRSGKPRRRGTGKRRLTDAQAVERVRRMTPWISRGGRRGRLVALTFDDGPGPITPALLAGLRRRRVPATFFQVADLVHAHPDLARAAQRPPFAVGSHTASHPYLSKLGPAAQRREIEGGAAAIEAAGGRYPRLFRPPYGHWNDATVRAARRNRMLMVFWSVSSRDWIHPDPRVIARRVVSRVRPGAIVLMHDFGGVTREPTLQAVPIIVRALRRKGYRFVTVPRMLRDAPPERRPARPPSPYPL